MKKKYELTEDGQLKIKRMKETETIISVEELITERDEIMRRMEDCTKEYEEKMSANSADLADVNENIAKAGELALEKASK